MQPDAPSYPYHHLSTCAVSGRIVPDGHLERKQEHQAAEVTIEEAQLLEKIGQGLPLLDFDFW